MTRSRIWRMERLLFSPHERAGPECAKFQRGRISIKSLNNANNLRNVKKVEKIVLADCRATYVIQPKKQRFRLCEVYFTRTFRDEISVHVLVPRMLTSAQKQTTPNISRSCLDRIWITRSQ
ncbi:hypothetical protein EVAR_67669_1 [Eumeta japonica]|uniref:Uncharacterized protein n=1 Tax=Eumeta variegata TaxID=151549 RepID=A0A4C1Z8P3_EUMVA|nr:hypothetical protein EVAR_67669_1 [Eumeta japonica]